VTAYEVQGRRTTRGADGAPCEVVRLASAPTSSQALGIAEAMAADGLTAWVFETGHRSGRKTYALLRVVRGGA
jgi:hypothetical protein